MNSGSTHSFIDDKLVKELKFTAEIVTPLLVTVANGSSIVIDTICKELTYDIQNHKFRTDLRPFPLGGSDLILRVDWLKEHNPITLDYHKFCIFICKDGVLVNLQGDTPTGNLQVISSKSMSKLLKSKTGVLHGCIYMVKAVSLEPPASQLQDKSL